MTARRERRLLVLALVACACVTLAFAAACARGPATPPSPAASLPHAAVRGFERVPSLDATATGAGDSLPNRVLVRYGGSTGGGVLALSWRTKSGVSSIAPERWLAYRSPGGMLFWLAGEDGKVALVRPTQARTAYLVDASATDRVLAAYELK